jgi:hypothetical protein
MTVHLSAMKSLIAKLEAQKAGRPPVSVSPVSPPKNAGETEKVSKIKIVSPVSPVSPEKAIAREPKREQRQDRLRTEADAVISEWRSAIAQIKPTLPEVDKLKTASLRFLDAPEAAAAVANGWDAVSLFGMHECNAPKERVGGWGLVIFMAWGVHKCTVEEIEPDVCRLRTRSGAIQSQQRRKAEHDHAVPWWQHPGVMGEMEGSDHD